MKFETLDEITDRVTLDRLRHFRWNKTQAADSLGITVKTLYNRLAVIGWTKEKGLDGEGLGCRVNGIKPFYPNESQLDERIQIDRGEADQGRLVIGNSQGPFKPIKGSDEESE